MLNNKPLLIGIIILLTLARFVFVPWSEAQESQQDALKVITKRLESALAAEQNLEPMAESLANIRQQQATLKSALLSANTDTELSIKVQKAWSEKASEHSVQLEMFDWRSYLLLSAPDIYQARIVVRLTGDVVKVATLITQIEQQTGVNIMTLRLNNDRNRSSSTTVNANLELQLLFIMDAT